MNKPLRSCATRQHRAGARSNLRVSACTRQADDAVPWAADLPGALRGLAVAPVRFEVARDAQALAERVEGYDGDGQCCYRAFRHVVTRLRADDDDVFYEEPVRVEWLTGWRLANRRWLVLRRVSGDAASCATHSRLSVSEAAPC